MYAAPSSSVIHRPRLHPAVGPFLLLTVLTSLAFNRATLARQAAEDQRRHLVQVNLLQDELRKLVPLTTATTRTSLWSSLLWRSKSSAPAASLPSPEHDAAEEESLARKCLAVGLDPQRLGISEQHIPNISSTGIDGSEVTWSEALFGKGTWDKMRTSLVEAGAALRASAGIGGGQQGSATGDERGGEEQQQDEYEAAFLQYTQRLEEEERNKTQAPPAEVRSPQYQPSPAQQRTLSAADNAAEPVTSGNGESIGADTTAQPARSDPATMRRRFIV